MRIVKYPHPALRHKSRPLLRVDGELRTLVRRMFDLMYEHRGVGLAANQVDLPYRLFVLNVSGESTQPEDELVFINPEIKKRSGMAEADEGCLSFPEIFAPVKRPNKVSVVAYNLAGEEVHYDDVTGMLARAVQHETDHLDGMLFIDRLSATALASIREELEDLELEFAGDRSRGLVPDDGQIAARLAELEALRT